MVRKIVLIGLLFVVAGCDIVYLLDPKHPLIEAKPNLSNKLRIDGFFYCVRRVKYVHDKDSIKYTSAYTFIPYRNGCFEGLDFCGGRYEYNDDSKTVISGIESCIFNSLRIVDNASLNSSLGAYRILGDSIILQKESGRFGESLVEYSGVIDNDTTFVIKKVKVTGSAVSSENRIKNVNFIYSFRKFNPKPDSTNNFKK